MSKSWFLYLLRCADGSLYTGVTTDLERRLREHNAGRGSRYTAARRPVWLTGSWRFADRSSAQKAEAWLRRRPRTEKELAALEARPVMAAPYCGPQHDRFCPRCGDGLEAKLFPGDTHARQACTGCGRVHYANSKPCVGALVIRHGKLLLVRRTIEPFLDYWDIPGGFLEAHEPPERGLVREVREETGLEVEPLKLFGFYLDQYIKDGQTPIFTFNAYFLARPIGGIESAGEETAELGWFGPEELPKRIAFDHAHLVLDDWQRWQRNEESVR